MVMPSGDTGTVSHTNPAPEHSKRKGKAAPHTATPRFRNAAIQMARHHRAAPQVRKGERVSKHAHATVPRAAHNRTGTPKLRARTTFDIAVSAIDQSIRQGARRFSGTVVVSFVVDRKGVPGKVATRGISQKVARSLERALGQVKMKRYKGVYLHLKLYYRRGKLVTTRY